MTNNELLELAAKAAGIKIDKSKTNGAPSPNNGFDLLGNLVTDWHNGRTWNPLNNNGDALRLAVKLRMLVDMDDVSVNGIFYPDADHDSKMSPDRLAATRRVIVLAAADLGKNMK